MGEANVAGTISTGEPLRKPARIWPVLWVVILQLGLFLAWTSPAVNSFPRFLLMMAGPLLCGTLFSIALIFASGFPWKLSIGALVASLGMCIVCAVFAAPRSAIGAWLYGVPAAIVAMGMGLIVSREWSSPARFRLIVGCSAAVFALLGLTRVEGTNGYFLPTFQWRWTPTAEARLLRQDAESLGESVTSAANSIWQVQEEEWPGFRGPTQDGQVREVLPKLDWTAAPPREVWRRQVGPAWSSSCIVSGRLFTQEQRGEQEVLACYDALTGKPIWAHEEASRFEEINSGAGPRGTPCYADGRVFCYGARGILSAVDATSGELLWRHDLMQEVDAGLPIWGFTNSPRVFGELVVIYAGGQGSQGLMAFECATGAVRWTVEGRGMNFGSVQSARLADQETLLFAGAGGVAGIDPVEGSVLWRYETKVASSPPIVQPQQLDTDSVLVPFGDDRGIARIQLMRSPEGDWSVTEQWRSRNLKPWYNDFLVHEGSIFGFDKQIFAAVDVADGSRRWKRGRFGFGQALMLTRQSQVIVTTERGEVILLDVDADTLQERGRFQAFDRKSWNHPAVAAGRLYVRSDNELACYEL